MKFLYSFLKKIKGQIKKTGASARLDSARLAGDQEMFLKQGKEQFKTLIKKGLNVPVTLL